MNSTSGPPSRPAGPPSSAIAVVGMAGRFPGANSVSAFWANLRRGEESITTLSADALTAAGVGAEVLADPAYVRRAPILDGIDEFDADFFDFTPQAARTTDPQHRLFLQCAWHALEDASCDPARFDGSIGVYAASSASGYLGYNLLSHRNLDTLMGQGANIDLIGLSFQNEKDFLTTRVSHQLNLRGPSIAVQTACSSSLVAVHLACQSLLNDECDMALAGGVSIRIPHHVGYWHEPGSILSAAGHCRPFDVRADGTVFGSGVGIVVLKPLRAALDDGNRIHAVIRGSAVNNDGSMKMGFAAPSAAAQADVIAEAHAVADVDCATIGYIETHGTGTPLGDPIEIDGLRRVFGASAAARRGPCVLGSVKSNIGHLEVASGIAGLIKTILCLKNRAIPSTLHFVSPNPELHLDRGPFVVRSEYGAWQADGVRRAGVSSFGVGGTNAHVVVEEAPPGPVQQARSGPQVLLVSAGTAGGLKELRSALAAELSGPDAPDLSDVAFTLAGRRGARFRMAAVVHDHQQAVRVLEAAERDSASADEVFAGESIAGELVAGPGSDSRVVFLFPGQGAQHAGMARGLYESEPVFAAHFDACAEGFADTLGVDLRAEVFDGPGTNLERTDHAQSALFAVEYALAALVASYGVHPSALAGHSIGEYVAATLAGVFDLPTAITAVSARARLMQSASPGAMAAVALAPGDIAEHLPAGLDLAAINDPGNCVVAGSGEAIGQFADRLAERGIAVRRMRTSHAFHSGSMEPALPEFAEILARLSLREPTTPLLSNVTGTWMTAEEATDPARWVRQMRATVRFSDELDAVLQAPARVLMEVGPGGSLTASATRQPRWSSQHRAVRLMRHQLQSRDDRDTFLLGLGQLWSAGVGADWSRLRTGVTPRGVALPGYPFDRQRHWVEHRPSAVQSDGSAPTDTGRPVTLDGAKDGVRDAGGGRQQRIEATLHRIWAESLGVESIDRNANFFELGGDSVSAIGLARNLTKAGLDISPQDLFQHQSVAALSAALAARYGAGGLAEPCNDAENPPVPPNIAYFAERGLRDPGRWRVPVILRLGPEVSFEDVRSVLTAVTNHHDALRLHIVERAGICEQHIAEPGEFSGLLSRSLPGDVAGGPAERDAVLAALSELVDGRDSPYPPLAATYITGAQDGRCHLAIAIHHVAGDDLSREILMTDIFTAFGQRLAGEDIALQPVTTTWREWSQRCAGLATHAAILKTREFWLDNARRATLRVADRDTAEPPYASDLTRLSSTLAPVPTAELDDAQRRLRLPVDEMLLAALGRTIALIVGEGVLAVDLAGHGRSVLQPDVDLHRTVGWFTTIYPVPLSCTLRESAGATQTLDAVHRALEAVPHHGIGHGLLRYVYAPTARQLAAEPQPDVFVSYVGTIPSFPSGQGPVQFDVDAAMPAREMLPGLGHAIELRVYRSRGLLHLDWWYDSRRLTPAKAEALTQRFPVALAELTAEALASTGADGGITSGNETPGDAAFTLVDLSSLDSA